MSVPKLTTETLKKALWLFCDVAYFKSSVPVKIIDKTSFSRKTDLLELLQSKAIIESKHIDEANHIEKYWIRMGNDFYPHMKVCITKMPINASFILSVDTHDQHVLDILPKDTEQWKKFSEVQKQNMRLKKKVEKRWKRENIPTEQSYLEVDVPENIPDKESYKLRHVLIADDEPHIQMALVEILNLFNCRSYVASNGAEAIKIARQQTHNIAFAIFDIMMPEVTGFDIVKTLEAENQLTFPFMFLSGMPKDVALKEREYNFLAKPFTKSILIEKIKEIIHQLPD